MQATISFGTSAPTTTQVLTYTVDNTPPTSSVNALPADSPETFNVSWSGQDNTGGSGIASYNIWVSDNGGAYTPLLTNTTLTATTFIGQPGHTYSFYSVATDNVGNVQPTPSQAQATTTVFAPTSSVAPLPAYSPTNFTVSWAGSAPGSSIASYDVYVSDDGGAFTRWQTATTQTSATYAGQTDHTYGFYSVATDGAGDVQPTPAGAQAQTTALTLDYQYPLAEIENGTPTAVTISTVLAGHDSDPVGANAKGGIAVVGLAGNGNWQYSTNGTTWTTITSVAQEALLLPVGDSLHFVPAANSSGQADLMFLAWDGSQGTAGSFFDITNTGGATPFSAAAGSVVVTVNPVPLWIGTGATLTPIVPTTYNIGNPSPPAGNLVSAVFGNYFHDDNLAVTVGVAVTALTGTSSGVWQYSTNARFRVDHLPRGFEHRGPVAVRRRPDPLRAKHQDLCRYGVPHGPGLGWQHRIGGRPNRPSYGQQIGVQRHHVDRHGNREQCPAPGFVERAHVNGNY